MFELVGVGFTEFNLDAYRQNVAHLKYMEKSISKKVQCGLLRYCGELPIVITVAAFAEPQL